MLASLTFILLGLIFIVVKLVLIVPMKEVCIIERLGKFRNNATRIALSYPLY